MTRSIARRTPLWSWRCGFPALRITCTSLSTYSQSPSRYLMHTANGTTNWFAIQCTAIHCTVLKLTILCYAELNCHNIFAGSGAGQCGLQAVLHTLSLGPWQGQQHLPCPLPPVGCHGGHFISCSCPSYCQPHAPAPSPAPASGVRQPGEAALQDLHPLEHEEALRGVPGVLLPLPAPVLFPLPQPATPPSSGVGHSASRHPRHHHRQVELHTSSLWQLIFKGLMGSCTLSVSVLVFLKFFVSFFFSFSVSLSSPFPFSFSVSSSSL